MEKQLAILSALCNLPTAPYHEQHVIAWLLAWAKTNPTLKNHRDKAGNLYLEYGKKKKNRPPLYIEAHMDHPGFILKSCTPAEIKAEFWGGVKPSHFTNARAKFWHEKSAQWIPAAVTAVTQKKNAKHLDITLTGTQEKLPKNSIGMWDLPDASATGQLFSARVCDDIVGVAAIVCLLTHLLENKIDAHVIGFFSRAEEVGFAGVLAACELNILPKHAAYIGLETSKGLNFAPQGAGPIIRVGDRTGIFSPGLTHFLTQAAGHLADASPASNPFKSQRKLMDGGMCSTTALVAYGYDAAALCICIGNYHNMHIENETGFNQAPTASPLIASETIHLADFAGMIQILIEAATRMPTYQPNFAALRTRLAKMHADEQHKKLYATSDQK